ncbi:MAG: sensor histidine kinase [Bacteroidales bacterium]|nr:sensor histidine kinase [Bacteroidales bacterium]MCF8457581.1 sensor histidine kinase [Bacteroidales bacterium]
MDSIASSEIDTLRYFNKLHREEGYNQEISYDSLILYSDSLLLCFNKGQKTALIPFAYYQKGRAFRKKAEFDSAKFNLYLSRNLAIQNHYDSIKADAEILIGLLYQELGQIDSAKFFLEQSLESYRLQYDTIGMAKSCFLLAAVYSAMADYPLALQYALKSDRLSKNQRNPHNYHLSLLNTANIYEKLNEYDKALEMYDHCYAESLALTDWETAARALTNRAVIHFRHKEYLEAEIVFLEAIEFFKNSENRKMQARLYSNISLVYNKLGKLKKANVAAISSLQIAEELNLMYDQISALINLGMYAKQESKYPKAEKFYLKALELSQKEGFRNETLKLYYNLANLNAIQGKFEQAYQYRISHSELKDSIINETKTKQIAELNAKYETEEKQARILALENEQTKKELANQKLRSQRNIYLGSLGALGLVLFLIVRLYRLKSKKDKIINEQRIRQLEDEKKLLAARSVLEGQEHERQRISRELHDGIGVLLSTASIHFSNLKEKSKDIETVQMARTANDFLQKASNEVRRISHNMMPVVLQKFGLCDALEDLFDEVAEAGNIEIDHTIESTHKRFPENIEVVIYRIVQEMINNTLKHANANHINFSFTTSGENIHLLYKDDGKGFDPKKFHGKGSFGLSGIYSRIDYLNGKLILETAPGKGCSYFIEVPA